jgi:ribosomal protein S18 acetylase RimI-like enzyme
MSIKICQYNIEKIQNFYGIEEEIHKNFQNFSFNKLEKKCSPFLVKFNNNFVGFFLLIFNGRHAQLFKFVVFEKYRKIGIGNEILKQICSKKFGINNLSLLVKTKNTCAVKFYEKFGFKLNKKMHSDELRKYTFNCKK